MQTSDGTPTRIPVTDPLVLVLARGESDSARNNTRGHLFESFVARLLHEYGYSRPTTTNLNVSADGIEVDVVADHDLSGEHAIAECKAYKSPVAAALLATFHSKVITSRFEHGDAAGYFFALPRLTSEGKQYAEKIGANDPKFKIVTAVDVFDLLLARRVIVPAPVAADRLVSDPAVVVTEHGTFAATLELDPITRTTARVLVWAPSGPVPQDVLDLLAEHEYSQESGVEDARQPTAAPAPAGPPATESSKVVQVSGSRSDFEYQLPAAPKFFVGRKSAVQAMRDAIDGDAGVLVLNAQSGWGKSSAALRLKALIEEYNGAGFVVDSRTAAGGDYIPDAIRQASLHAQASGVLALPNDASWGTLTSAFSTLERSVWVKGRKLLIFFDQFENVFREVELTRNFRDLALSARELTDRLLIGFAWKTDLVGWVEGHPYQYRDQIRDGATVIPLGPMGASDVDLLLRRLEKEIGQALARDLRSRLREYSQGLPWLFKKLAGHVLRELRQGTTQEQLANEALNVAGLFTADLAELSPIEHEGLNHIARYAPISISEVLERVSAPVVESLVNRRLVVQVGERLDTYWDIFRDYLNTGRVPVEESYVLRQSLVSIYRLLREVIVDGGNSKVSDIATRLSISESGVFNLSRDLRLLGATLYETGRVHLAPDIWEAEDRESALRNRVASSLKRHRAHSAFASLSNRIGRVTINSYAREIPNAFPAVEVSDATWQTYARVLLQWFEYAGLAVQDGMGWVIAPDGSPGVGELMGARVRRSVRGGFPHDSPRRSLELLVRLASGGQASVETNKREAAPLLTLGAISESSDGSYHLRAPGLVVDGTVVPAALLDLMRKAPGVEVGLDLLRVRSTNLQVGRAIREAVSADWLDSTAEGLGGHLRAWARAAGFPVAKTMRRTPGSRESAADRAESAGNADMPAS
jgi:hypothetical protein